jgi:hypothetical protein
MRGAFTIDSLTPILRINLNEHPIQLICKFKIRILRWDSIWGVELVLFARSQLAGVTTYSWVEYLKKSISWSSTTEQKFKSLKNIPTRPIYHVFQKMYGQEGLRKTKNLKTYDFTWIIQHPAVNITITIVGMNEDQKWLRFLCEWAAVL